MVKYHPLFHRPQVSAWVCFTWRRKFILFFTILFFIIGLIIYVAKVTEINNKIARIYNIQATIGDMLDYEVKHLPKINELNKWKETLISQGHIYSAYLDTRPEEILEENISKNENETTWAMIRIIAILPTKMSNGAVNCVYKYRNKNEDELSENFIIKIRKSTSLKQIASSENFDMRYSAFFILCDLTVPSEMNYQEFYSNQHLPYEITIINVNENEFDVEKKNDTFVEIFYSDNGISMTEYSNNFMAVCVPVLHHNFDRVSNIIEFIEFYQMMGVSHFTFYNRSISSKVNNVLEYYKIKGVVTILPWDLPEYFIFEKTLRVDGIFAALNDCLYRNSFYKSYMYIAAVDVDEFIVPRKHKDFLDMMQYLDPFKTNLRLNNQASFLFRNMFFYTMFEDDPVTLAPDVPKMYMQSKTLRWTQINPGRERSKYIVRGRQTVELGNHHSWQLRKTTSAFNYRYNEVTVDLEIAASHHYRACETNVETCWLRSTVRDRTAHRFTVSLGERIARSCKNIFNSSCPKENKHK